MESVNYLIYQVFNSYVNLLDMIGQLSIGEVVIAGLLYILPLFLLFYLIKVIKDKGKSE